MDLTRNIQATRIHGTLTVDLADGRTATVEVDLDVEGHDTSYAIEHEWPEFTTYGLLRPTMPLSTTYSIRVDHPRQERPLFTLRIPVDEETPKPETGCEICARLGVTY